MEAMFHPYPASFPKEAVTYMIPVLRGQMPDSRARAVNAVYAITGYGASFITDNDVQAMGEPGTLTAEQAANVLEDALRRRDSRLVSHAAAMPWAELVKFFGPLLAQWLAGQFIKK